MWLAVGGYTARGPGLGILHMQGTRMELIETTKAVEDPIWIETSKDGQILYVCGEDGETREGVVASFRWQNGLRLLSRQFTGGRACCHLALAPGERTLYAANYRDGSLAVFPVEEGEIQPRIQLIQHRGMPGPNPLRQQGPHVHQAVNRPETDEVFVCDLGLDEVAVYKRKTDGTLEPGYVLSCPPGIGPRHLVFDGRDRFYLVGELTGWLAVYEWKNGGFACLQLLKTAEECGEENTAAAIRLTDEAVYVSNRGHDSIAVFPRKKTGEVGRPHWVRTPGSYPRDFRLYDFGFLLAQQKCGGIAAMTAEGAALASIEYPGAVCLCPLK